MKNDPIRRLIKESGLETSEEFVDLTMEKLDQRIQQRMKVKLYLLISATVLLFMGMVVFLAYSGYTVNVFGLNLILPKIGTMVGISLVGFFVISYLQMMLNTWSNQKVEMIG